MKLVLRILPTVFALISITALADTVRENLNANVGIGPNFGAGDNVFVQLFGQGVSIGALGGTTCCWFDGASPGLYLPGGPGLGPTTVFWDDGAVLQIGSTGYDSNEFDLFPTAIDTPFITFPTNGKDFTVRIPNFVWELDGTIVPPGDCPSSGCNFIFLSKPGTLSFSYSFFDGEYFAGSASFSTPEPGTLTLFAFGIVAVGWRKFRPASFARSGSLSYPGIIPSPRRRLALQLPSTLDA